MLLMSQLTPGSASSPAGCLDLQTLVCPELNDQPLLLVGPVSPVVMRSAKQPPTPALCPKQRLNTSRPMSREDWEDQQDQEEQNSSAHVVEDFFWIGSSIVAFSRWRLGYAGMSSPEPCVCVCV